MATVETRVIEVISSSFDLQEESRNKITRGTKIATLLGGLDPQLVYFSLMGLRRDLEEEFDVVLPDDWDSVESGIKPCEGTVNDIVNLIKKILVPHGRLSQ